MATIAAPSLTFQYCEEGRLDPSDETVVLSINTPSLYRERFIAAWSRNGRDGHKCWERLQELVAGVLRKLPNNSFAIESAWACGLTSEIPARFREILDAERSRDDMRSQSKAIEESIVARAHETGEPQIIRTWVTDRCHNGNDEQCSFDQASQFALPDGSRRIEYTCCH